MWSMIQYIYGDKFRANVRCSVWFLNLIKYFVINLLQNCYVKCLSEPFEVYAKIFKSL